MKFKFNKTKAIEYITASVDKESDTVFVPSLGSDATRSIKSMRTTMVNGGFKEFINTHCPEEPKSDDDVNILIEKIEKKVKNIDINNSAELETLFHLIHLWGGNAGRGLYHTKRGGFYNNINMVSYKKLIKSAITSNNIKDIIKAIAQFEIESKNISVAFITKHTRFFSALNPTHKCIPIYDSVMSKNYMLEFKKKLNGYSHIKQPASAKLPRGREELAIYWDAMIQLSNYYQLPLKDLERILFVNAR